MPIDELFIQIKSKTVREYIKELAPLLTISSRQLVEPENRVKLRAIERNFQLIVDSIVDINTHIISGKNLPPSEDYQSTFMVLMENKILPSPFAANIAKVVGLRNKIVHDYGKVDKKFFVDQLKASIGDFDKYLQHLSKLIT